MRLPCCLSSFRRFLHLIRCWNLTIRFSFLL